jgi:uncharacterized repeat protein (TIGR03803 family)
MARLLWLPRFKVRTETLYGTTTDRGTIGSGTVFRVSPAGTLTTIYSFCARPGCSDGSTPATPLVLATDGNFYGTTYYGADASCSGGCGTVFKITPSGALTTLHRFNLSEGTHPDGALIQATDGNFYGTTNGGDSNPWGTVFKISSDGTLATLHTFDQSDGAYPDAALVQGADGNFYGTTYGGGASNSCLYECGTIFEMTPEGALTTLYNFDGINGANPEAALIQAADGNFYGTTNGGGGSGGYGTVFRSDPTRGADDAAQLQSYGRWLPCGRAGAGDRRELLRDNQRRGKRLL